MSRRGDVSGSPARTGATAAWLLSLSLAACDGAAAARNAAPSAEGVRVVENPGDARVVAWRLSAEPWLELGGGEDAGLSVPMAAVRTRDGFMVADAGTGELRFFDARGRPTHKAGRTGRGPGEFQFLAWAGVLPDDSLPAWDASLRRLTIFGPDGRYARDVVPQGLGGSFPFVYGVFDDGSLLVSTGMESAGLLPAEGRAWRDTIELLRIGRTGEVLDTVARVPGPARYQLTGASGIPRTNSVPFGPNTFAAVRGNTVYLATGDEYEIGVYGADGTPRRLIRKQVRPLRVTAADRESYEAGIRDVGGTPEQRRERQQMIREAPYPPTMSPVTAMAVGADGELWVKEAQPPDTWDRFGRWSVFDAEGRWIATVETPGRFVVEQVGEDWVLGRKTDPDGTAHVGIYRLIKR
ncbi:MAG TPA: hypothetical protein VGX50_05255 [Longimicrobium sp.]|nr:hypothetical protein [Longimicrobium sp.]